jgi:uroporphyrinogen decarboxylase
MTHRQRLQAVLAGKIPDCVPVAPDFSNMIPARLTGKPFWDLYLYNDPPIWEAYIAAARHFDIDSLMDGYFPLQYPGEQSDPRPWEQFIVFRSDERIVTQASYVDSGKRIWSPTVDVYYVADPPTCGVVPGKINLPEVPTRWEKLEGVKPVDTGPKGLKRIKSLMGDQGLVGAPFIASRVLCSEQDIYWYYDHPEEHEARARHRVEQVERRFAYIQSLEVKLDFLCVGGSGSLIFKTPDIYRQLAFPAVKRAIELAHAAGMPTHVHCCGPEKALVKILAEETDLTVIDPLEIPPMGDCDLAELKRLYGNKITLKGNLHTTAVMLRGSVDDVVKAAKQAIDDGAAGGRFILSTGDQCGRDTPDENLHALVETARTYGRY